MIFIGRENKDFLIKGTLLQCNKGNYKSNFEVSEKNVKIQGFSTANESDNVAGVHIKSFGSCSIMGTCKLDTELKGQFLIWFETFDKVILSGSKAIIEDSHCFCPYGGKITVFDSKQVDYASVMAELFGDFNKFANGLEESFEIASKLAVTQLNEAFNDIRKTADERLNEKLKLTNNSYMKMHGGSPPSLDEVKQLSEPTLKTVHESMLDGTTFIGETMLMQVVGINSPTYHEEALERLKYLEKRREEIEIYLRRNSGKIKDKLPDFTIKELFNEGMKKESVLELYGKGIDHKNKKMLRGLLGGDPEIAAVRSGYTHYLPIEEIEIVGSLSEGGKAAYILRTNANKGMSGVKTTYEVGGLIYAGYKSLKGSKVKTGSTIKKKEKTPIPQGFTNKEFDNFSEATHELIKKQNLPKGETYIHGSRAKGTARPDSDIDIMYRVDEKIYDEFTKNRINSIREGSALRKKIVKEAAKGKFGRYQISRTFNQDYYDILVPNSPIKDIDFSIIKKDSTFDTGPFIKVEDIKK